MTNDEYSFFKMCHFVSALLDLFSHHNFFRVDVTSNLFVTNVQRFVDPLHVLHLKRNHIVTPDAAIDE